MATIQKELIIEAEPSRVWDALADFHAVHTRLAPGFLTACEPDGAGARIVTFFNGMKARELLVTLDDAAMRLVYTVVGGRATHYNASVQVFPERPGKTRLVWTTDLLPDELAGPIGAMMDQGAEAMTRHLGRGEGLEARWSQTR
jgi:carbon monoxide dehydrogenase subunit G